MDKLKLSDDGTTAFYIALEKQKSLCCEECSICKREIEAGEVFGIILLFNPEEHFKGCWNCMKENRYFKNELEVLITQDLKCLQVQRNKLNRQISTLKKANLKAD